MHTKRPCILVLTPWTRRWEIAPDAGMSDDYHFLEGFIQNGFDVHFVNPRDKAPVDVPFEGYHVHTFPDFFAATARWPKPLRRVLWPLLFNVVGTWKALSVASSIEPNVIIGQTHYTALPAYIVRFARHIPSAVKLFGVMDLVRTDWPRWKYTFKNLEQIWAFHVPQDAWIILDDGTRGDAAARRHGVPADRVHFFPNGMNLEWLARSGDGDSARREYGIDGDTGVALFLARLQESKRPELFLAGLHHAISNSRRPLVGLVAGDGPDRARCEAVAARLGISDRVIFAGAVAHDRVPDLMAAADVFVATGRMSNMALSTCEAMVCGTPVVAFDVGNTRRVVRDGETGRAVIDGDAGALGTAIAELVNDVETRQRLGQGARRLARTEFTPWRERIEMEVSLIRDLIAGNVGAETNTRRRSLPHHDERK